MLKLHKLWFVIGCVMVIVLIDMTLSATTPIDQFHFNDKFLHLFGYGVLVGWFGQLYSKLRTRIIIVIVFALLGVTLEFLQGMGGVRDYEVGDMIANASGALIAFALLFTRLQFILVGFEKLVLPKNFQR